MVLPSAALNNRRQNRRTSGAYPQTAFLLFPLPIIIAIQHKSCGNAHKQIDIAQFSAIVFLLYTEMCKRIIKIRLFQTEGTLIA